MKPYWIVQFFSTLVKIATMQQKIRFNLKLYWNWSTTWSGSCKEIYVQSYASFALALKYCIVTLLTILPKYYRNMPLFAYNNIFRAWTVGECNTPFTNNCMFIQYSTFKIQCELRYFWNFRTWKSCKNLIDQQNWQNLGCMISILSF